MGDARDITSRYSWHQLNDRNRITKKITPEIIDNPNDNSRDRFQVRLEAIGGWAWEIKSYLLLSLRDKKLSLGDKKLLKK